ncbi:hypothetical protein KMZ29_22155 [Bradyrhizobium sediminis]|uniref:Uncharacterized protein n=1 Tax=Bradyrhizobium sediminis TaxID=2840469 RepID=A0A975NC51_9BRAD|nr:hypothetical protein [Bradyrhizobium sediminis]QWG12382.1 hypothetical protein KMZ29_22155 [Bradyrhizobium sediminis]
MNNFQLNLTKDVIELISPAAVGDVSVSISKGPNEVIVEAKLTSRNLSLWIYENGASILGNGIDIRFEVADHREPSVLAETFLKKVSETIPSGDTQRSDS